MTRYCTCMKPIAVFESTKEADAHEEPRQCLRCQARAVKDRAIDYVSATFKAQSRLTVRG